MQTNIELIYIFLFQYRSGGYFIIGYSIFIKMFKIMQFRVLYFNYNNIKQIYFRQAHYMQNRIRKINSPIVSYRNAFYQGSVNKSMERDGFGMLVTDDAEVLFANWKNNKIIGKYVFISDELRACGEIQDCKLVEYNIVESKTLKIFGKFQQNNLNGDIIFKQGSSFKIVKYEDGNLKDKNIKTYPSSSFQQQFQKLFPKKPYNILDFFFNSFLKQSQISSSFYFDHIILNQSYTYFGFIDKNNLGSGLGCILRTTDAYIYSCGIYKNTQLNGLGRLNLNSDILFDGMFKNNKLNSVGINYSKLKDKLCIYIQQQGKLKKQEIPNGNVNIVLKQIRKQFHLRSTHFKNQFIFSDLLIRIKNLKNINVDSNNMKQVIRDREMTNSTQKRNLLRNINENKLNFNQNKNKQRNLKIQTEYDLAFTDKSPKNKKFQDSLMRLVKHEHISPKNNISYKQLSPTNQKYSNLQQEDQFSQLKIKNKIVDKKQISPSNNKTKQSILLLPLPSPHSKKRQVYKQKFENNPIEIVIEQTENDQIKKMPQTTMNNPNRYYYYKISATTTNKNMRIKEQKSSKSNSLNQIYNELGLKVEKFTKFF